MRVFITGGTGFIGTNLALRHVEMGDQVVVVSKEATAVERENARDLKHAGVEVLRGSITDDALVAQAMRGAQRVYHIAAAMREANIPDQVFWDVNVEATRRMLDLARSEGVERFVYCSSIGAMGWSNTKPANEETPCKPEDIYQVTKKAAEELCLEFQARHNFPLSIVRPADVYGPRDRRLLKMFKSIRKGRFALIGSGKNEHHMVYIDDMVQGFLLAGEKEAAIGQVFIIAGECPVTVGELARLIAEVEGVKAPGLKVPLLPVQAAAVVVERACKPFGIQPPLYPRRVNFFHSDYAFDITKARKLLGYHPQVSLRDGLRRTMEWYEERGLLGGVTQVYRAPDAREWIGEKGNRGIGDAHEYRRVPETGRVVEVPVKISAPAGGGERWGVNGNAYEAGGGTARHEPEVKLSARCEAFDSFWEGPEEVEKGYSSFGQFYQANYLSHFPTDKNARILVTSCGPGYMVNLLKQEGYTNLLGIDSDAEKVEYALEKGLNCRPERAFPFLIASRETYDLIFVEQELNHLTKDEMVWFLDLCWDRLREGGRLIVHGLNGANPITGAEALAQNFDHFNTFTDYSLRQVLNYCGFRVQKIIPLDLYVFKGNPFNYVAKFAAQLLSVLFRAGFILYGKHNKIFTKKIAAVADKQPGISGSRLDIR